MNTTLYIMNTTLTQLEQYVFTNKKTIAKSQRIQMRAIIELEQNKVKYDKSQIRSQITNFIKYIANRNSSDSILELLVSDLNKLFYEWRHNNNIINSIDNTNLGVVIHHLKINGISKGRRKSSGNTKIFNIQQIRDHFNEGTTQTPH